MSTPIPAPPNLAPIRARLDEVEAAARHPDWDEVQTPIIIAHRGSGNIAAPENTMAAYQWAAALGYPVEADLQYTADGAIVCHHDATLDRMAGLTGGVTAGSLLLDQVRGLDMAQGYQPDIFSPQRIPTFEEYLQLGRHSLLIPEVRGSTGKMGADVARRVVRAGMQQSVVVQAFDPAELSAVKAVDPSIRTLLLSTSAVSVETAQALGLWGVAIERTALPSLGASYVSAMQAAGFRVLAYTVNSLREAESLLAIGVDGYFSDDAAHIARAGTRLPTGTTTIKVPPGFLGSGWHYSCHLPRAVPRAIGGFATFHNRDDFTDLTNFRLVVGGYRTADVPETQTITTKLKVVAPSPTSNTSRYVALRFCWNAENDGLSFAGNATSNGYYVVVRMNGWAELVRVIDGAFVNLAVKMWTPLNAGEEIPLRVNLTATSITVTRTDTGATITADDTTHPRGGLVVLFGSGMVPGIGDVTITY